VALTTTEDTALGQRLKIADFDASTGSMTITLIVASGMDRRHRTANVVVSGSGSGTVTLTGTLANLNSYLVPPYSTRSSRQRPTPTARSR